MKQHVEQVSKWCYDGLWGILARWFRVPGERHEGVKRRANRNVYRIEIEALKIVGIEEPALDLWSTDE